MIFGVNVSGERLKPPPGQLDVRLPTKGLSEVAGIEALTASMREGRACDLHTRSGTFPRRSYMLGRRMCHAVADS